MPAEGGVDVGLWLLLGVLLQQIYHAPQVAGPGGHLQRRVRALLAVALDHGRPIYTALIIINMQPCRK